MRGYDPVAAAEALRVPMLFIQGGRDYQVTVADDLALWRAGLSGRTGITFRVFEPDNHLLAAGLGPSSPAERSSMSTSPSSTRSPHGSPGSAEQAWKAAFKV